MLALARRFIGWGLAGFLCISIPIVGALEPVTRSKAAAIALAAFGGKVLSVEEVEKDPLPTEGESANAQPNVHFEVKLLQTGGRVKVVHLDEFGQIL